MKMRTECPVCRLTTGRGRTIFHRDFSPATAIVPFRSYDVCACSGCGMIYAGNIEESMPLSHYYEMLSRYEGAGFVLAEPIRRLYVREVDFIEKHAAKNARVLDIGCAFGGLLAEMNERGYTSLSGLELSAKNCRYMRDTFGIAAYEGGLGKIPDEVRTRKFDLIILSGVLEHLFDLRGAVAECRSLLAAGGLLYVLVPDMEQFPLHDDLYQEFSVEHINYFDTARLQTLFSRCGMGLVDACKDEVPLFGLAGNIHSLWNVSKESKVTDYESGDDAMAAYLQNCAALSERLKRRINTFDLSGGAYIWGAGTQTAMLFQLAIVKSCDVRGIIDSNRNYHGRTAYGHEIAAPESLRAYPDVPILISSQYAQEAIARVISEQLNLPNPVLRLFDAAQ